MAGGSRRRPEAPLSTAAEQADVPVVRAAPVQLRAAYGVCRSVTRAAARNFYYAFLVLPRRKRDSLCAVYAFMRHADDVSDDPALSRDEKRTRLAAWIQSLHGVLAGKPTDEAVLLALADTQRRFKIPVELLEKLVEGTAMDVNAKPVIAGSGGVPAVLYRTFDDLYHYCYHVASVVGLVCIRIFGYRDPRADELAEQCGVAFQLTNIIRDVREDAALGRVYLPLDDLHVFGLAPNHLVDGTDTLVFRPLLAMQADRARKLYASADELLPLIEDECRPALWVLVTIYRKLLEKIATRQYDVFTERVSLTTREKLRVLAKGMAMRLRP